MSESCSTKHRPSPQIELIPSRPRSCHYRGCCHRGQKTGDSHQHGGRLAPASSETGCAQPPQRALKSTTDYESICDDLPQQTGASGTVCHRQHQFLLSTSGGTQSRRLKRRALRRWQIDWHCLNVSMPWSWLTLSASMPNSDLQLVMTLYWSGVERLAAVQSS